MLFLDDTDVTERETDIFEGRAYVDEDNGISVNKFILVMLVNDGDVGAADEGDRAGDDKAVTDCVEVGTSDVVMCDDNSVPGSEVYEVAKSDSVIGNVRVSVVVDGVDDGEVVDDVEVVDNVVVVEVDVVDDVVVDVNDAEVDGVVEVVVVEAHVSQQSDTLTSIGHAKSKQPDWRSPYKQSTIKYKAL